MKVAFSVAAFLCASSACFASETAYHALRAVGNQRGQEVLNHVIEVNGRGGTPNPARWRIVLDDSSARGGVRELEVNNGKVVSERTPVGNYAGTAAVMDFQKLNLDSEGAFSIAEKEAKKTRLGFDSVDYTLRSGEEGRSPLWVVRLLDSSRRVVGTMNIAADTGAVSRSDLFGRQRESADVPDERVRPNNDDRPVRDDEEYTDENGKRLRVGHRINKALHQAGGAIEQFFTGRRTIDRRYRDEGD